MKEKAVMFNFKDGSKEIKVGDTLYVPANRSGLGTTYTVAKIGRDLVTCTNNRETKFYIKTGYLKSEYTSCRAYSSQEAFEEYIKVSKYIREVTDLLSRQEITLDKAKQIAIILGYER